MFLGSAAASGGVYYNTSVLQRTEKNCQPTAGDALYVKSEGRRTDTDNRPTIFSLEQKDC